MTTAIALPSSNTEPVTLLDVARVAGVSPSTVSRILNGTARVAPAKREAVEAAIAQLQFRPNIFARSLKTGITMTVGVLTQSIESQFYARALKGIEVGLEASGHSPLIVSGHWNARTDVASLKLLTSRRVDGVIILTSDIADADVLAVAKQQPVVITERALEGPNLRSIHVDQKFGGYLATQHLLALGHTRIAHIAGVDKRSDAQDRYQGYLQAHAEAGLEPDARLLVRGDFTDQGGHAAAQQLMDSGVPFSAIFCANDDTAQGARLALYQRGLRVPEDVSLVGFDDMPTSRFMTPPLTSVRQPVYQVGLYAARMLLEMMGYPAETPQLPPLELMVRETTAKP
nr:LacI family DNA-binding transcriptional regulator [uncultured Rhodoferax sp.]